MLQAFEFLIIPCNSTHCGVVSAKTPIEPTAKHEQQRMTVAATMRLTLRPSPWYSRFAFALASTLWAALHTTS